MGNDAPTIALAELAAGRLGPVEAVTIVREIANRIAEGSLPGVPSPQVIRLTGAGSIAIEGPIAADARSVGHAAYLLQTLLPSPDLPTRTRVPGALRLVVARAMGTLDLPPYASLGAFADALARFAAPDASLCIEALVLSRTLDRALPESLPLAANSSDGDTVTISDIRRARRATGLTLTDVSDRTGIPAPLLCELEWGYLRRWPAPAAARRLLVRYARATGLDDELVLRTVWPILEEQIRERDRKTSETSIVDAVAVHEDPIVTVEVSPPVITVSPVLAHYPERNSRKPRRRAIVVAALAIPALLLGIAPSLRSSLTAHRHAAAQASTVRAEPTDAVDTQRNDPVAAPAPQSAEATSSIERVSISNAVADPPSFASVGSAMFHEPSANARPRAEGSDSAALLKITSVIDDGAHNFHARPSPDGRRIAFDSDRDGARGVYLADKNGAHVRRVSGDGFAAIPSWSPDGNTLAYVRAEPAQPHVWNMWTVTLSDGQHKRVTSYESGQVWGASWFPDGQRVAFTHDGHAVVMNLRTDAVRTYPSPRKAPLAGVPAVSPDGTRVLFQITGDGTWLLDLRSGAMKKILSDPSAETYTWSPDGRRVAYHSRATDTWGVWIMPGR
jgi:cytoskeletal protein RodZ